MITDLQKKTAQAIVNIFETSSALGEYGKVTLLRDDTGHLTYGRSQTTLASGNLFLLIKAYCEEPAARFASGLRPFLPRLVKCDVTLDVNTNFHGLLRQAGDDEVMHLVQDNFFDRVYWTPALQRAQSVGIATALGTGVVYDSTVHGSWGVVRDLTNKDLGTISVVGEEVWVQHYVRTRRTWLANHKNQLLHRTVYRMDAFQEMITASRWSLPLPMRVRGVAISEEILASSDNARISAQTPDERILLLKNPKMKGEDVKQVQRALASAGFPIADDGVFGSGTDKLVKSFQKQRGLKPDGIVGQATRVALGL